MTITIPRLKEARAKPTGETAVRIPHGPDEVRRPWCGCRPVCDREGLRPCGPPGGPGWRHAIRSIIDWPTSMRIMIGVRDDSRGLPAHRGQAPRIRLELKRVRREHGSCRSPCTTRSTTRLSLYAATKKANELMAHYVQQSLRPAHHGTAGSSPCTGRGGRPDMALFIFTKAILAEGETTAGLQPRQAHAGTSPTSTTSSKA